MSISFSLLLFVIPPSIYLINFIYTTLWLPWQTQKHFTKQGIHGPAYHPIFGNAKEIKKLIKASASKPIYGLCHDILHRVLPPYHKWSRQHGKTLLFWFGSKPHLIFVNPDMIKEALVSNTGCIGKEAFNPLSKQLFGQGLVGLQGDKWTLHRKIANQAFTMERVKAWVPEIVASTVFELKKWEEQINGSDEVELDVHKSFHNLSADIISRTAFGSSYEEGKRIFDLQDKQTVLTLQANSNLYFPGLRFLPTESNRAMWRLEKEIRESVRALIQTSSKHEERLRNLLTLLMQADGEGNEGLSAEEVIDECKTFYFAGKETTANVLSWTLLLLAMHPEWQDRTREEAVHVCQNNEVFSANKLNELKHITMVLHETMRLYPPVARVVRHTTKDVKLGGIEVPAKTGLNLPIVAVHHDVEIWGPTAREFHPMRFLEPRKHLAAYLPFGLGPRICVGQNLAMVEAKIVLAMILRRFRWRLSPSYVHAPILSWTLAPQYGAQIIMTRIGADVK